MPTENLVMQLGIGGIFAVMLVRGAVDLVKAANSRRRNGNGTGTAVANALMKSDVAYIKGKVDAISIESRELHATHLGPSGLDENNEEAWKNNTKLAGQRHEQVTTGLKNIAAGITTSNKHLKEIEKKLGNV